MGFTAIRETAIKDKCLVLFVTTGCPHCEMTVASNEIESIARAAEHVPLYVVNAEASEEMVSSFGVQAVPALLSLKDGKLQECGDGESYLQFASTFALKK